MRERLLTRLLDRATSPVRVVVVSVAVSVLLGVPVATLLAGLMGGAPRQLFSIAVGPFPVLAWAFLFGGPIAAIYGGMAAIALLAALSWSRWRPRWYGWLVTGSAVGIVVSGLPTGLALVGMAAHDPQPVLIHVLGVFTTTGFVCGAVLGLYGWQERRRLGGRIEGPYNEETRGA